MNAPDAIATIGETHNPLLPVGSDIVGTALSILVTAAIIGAICLLVWSCRRGRGNRRD